MVHIHAVVLREQFPIRVIAIGHCCRTPDGEDSLVPVKLEDGEYALVLLSSSQVLYPDTQAARDALRASKQMPEIRLDINGDALRIRGFDERGVFFVKMFYCSTRPDELHR